MAGLTRVSGGSLRVLGVEMHGVHERDFRPVRSRIGFVFQDPATSFNPLLTIAECVAEPLVVHGHAANAAGARARVDELLEAVQLPSSYGARYPHELSGGQRQRASLARALALDPELLIADEPTSALDVSVQARVLDLFDELHRELGFACLFISHDLAVVDMLADRIAVLYRGKLVEEGTGDEVLGSPKDPYTQRLLASLPVPDPIEQATRRAEWDRLRAADARLSAGGRTGQSAVVARSSNGAPTATWPSPGRGAAPSPLLGGIESHVGVPEHEVGAVAGRSPLADPRARRHRHLHSRYRPDHRSDPLRVVQRLRRGRAGQGDDELLPAEPRDEVERARGVPEHFTEALEHGVADQVTVGVVDVLEVVEVEHHHRERHARPRWRAPPLPPAGGGRPGG